MKYTDLKIQTQREFPNNARTPGWGWLVRAGYLTRENQLLPLGVQMTNRLEMLWKDPPFWSKAGLKILESERGVYFPLSTGTIEVAQCPACDYVDPLRIAKFKKIPMPHEAELPLEKISTPDCDTIEALASLLNIPKEKTAKAMMFTRKADGKFVFVAIRGDMQLSDAKLEEILGEIQLADAKTISRSGAAAGYASPVGLKDALIIVDDLIPESQNLVAGANEEGYHLLNTNYLRDYSAEIIADVVQAKAGDGCPNCGNPLEVRSAVLLASKGKIEFTNILLAISETHHDEKGLTLPLSASPFDVYLMHVPGRMLDTKSKTEEIHNALQNAGISVLFDDRDERAGVKFNDADLIGCPIRVTVGEKGLQNGMVELKPRKEKENTAVPLNELTDRVTTLLA